MWSSEPTSHASVLPSMRFFPVSVTLGSAMLSICCGYVGDGDAALPVYGSYSVLLVPISTCKREKWKLVFDEPADVEMYALATVFPAADVYEYLYLLEVIFDVSLLVPSVYANPNCIDPEEPVLTMLSDMVT